MLKVNVLMLWDGVGFFGTKFHKLARCEGVKFEWWHRLLEPTDMLIYAILIIVVLIVVFQEIHHLGHQSY